MNNLIKYLRFITLATALLCTGCVSSPKESRHEAIEDANTALSSGVNHYNKYKYESAISYFNDALRKFRSFDHPYGIASSCLNLAKSHLSIGNTDTAEAYLKQAQRIIESENFKKLENYLNIIKSSVAIENNQLAQAKEILEPLLNDNSNNAFTLAAIQNRTRIAFSDATSKNNNEQKRWTEKFEQKIISGEQIPSHKARLARFKAALINDANAQEKYFSTALNIYRQQTNRPGIAATLQEWADTLIQQNKAQSAQDKLLRALYIRQSLQDKKNSLKALNSLTIISNDNTSKTWIEKLKNKQFKQWNQFIAAFNLFPE